MIIGRSGKGAHLVIMAITTITRGREVITRFALSGAAVMAIGTHGCRGDKGMVKECRNPAGGLVAQYAVLVGNDVTVRFAGRGQHLTIISVTYPSTMTGITTLAANLS